MEDRLARATILASRGLWGEAARALGDLVAAAPRQPEVRFVMAFVALNRGQTEAAVQDADDALALRAHYPEARLLRAEALLRLASADEARRELARFLDEAPPTMVAERAQWPAQALASVPR